MDEQTQKEMRQRLGIREDENHEGKAPIFAALFARILAFDRLEAVQLLMFIDGLRPETVKRLAEVAKEEYMRIVEEHRGGGRNKKGH
jgi:hypothetical protein